MVKVNYKDLKHAVGRSCVKVGSYLSDFKVDVEKIREMSEELHLVFIPIGINAHRVTADDIPDISEFFYGENLAWFTDSKFITTLAFLDSSDLNEETQELIDKLYTEPDKNMGDPIDYVATAAELIANYHCYLAKVVSYTSNDPGRIGKNCYYINCKANKVILRDPEYNYNPQDI